jgi:hypothetical protein
MSPPAGRPSARAGVTRAAEDDVVAVDPERRVRGDLVDRVLESIVRKRLDSATVAADQVMVMIAARCCRLVVGTPRAKLEPMYEPELDEGLERAVHAGDTGPRPRQANTVVDLLDRQTAALVGERVDHGRPRAPMPVAGVAKDGLRMLRPAHT